MAHGDLHEFLIFHSPKSDLNESEDSGEGRMLTQSEMSYIAIQIAAGGNIPILLDRYFLAIILSVEPDLDFTFSEI